MAYILNSCFISFILKNITKSDKNIAPTFLDYHLLPNMNFNGHCLMKNNISITKAVINLYISYTQGPELRDSYTDFTLNNCLLRCWKLTKNADSDKYKYTVYDIGFASRSENLLIDGSYGKNFIIFGADMNSFLHVDNKGKDILILGEEPTQWLDDTTLTAEAKYPINFTQSGKIFVLGLHYKGLHLFADAIKVYQFKTENSEIKDYALFFDKPLKDFTINHMEKTRLKRVVNLFSADFNPIDNNEILDIHRWIMFWLIKKIFIGLLTGLVNRFDHTKCLLLSKQKCEIQPGLINLHPNE